MHVLGSKGLIVIAARCQPNASFNFHLALWSKGGRDGPVVWGINSLGSLYLFMYLFQPFILTDENQQQSNMFNITEGTTTTKWLGSRTFIHFAIFLFNFKFLL